MESSDPRRESVTWFAATVYIAVRARKRQPTFKRFCRTGAIEIVGKIWEISPWDCDPVHEYAHELIQSNRIVENCRICGQKSSLSLSRSISYPIERSPNNQSVLSSTVVVVVDIRASLSSCLGLDHRWLLFWLFYVDIFETRFVVSNCHYGVVHEFFASWFIIVLIDDDDDDDDCSSESHCLGSVRCGGPTSDWSGNLSHDQKF